MEICASAVVKDNWYQRKFREVKKNPTQHPNYRIEGGKLFRHLLHTLDFNDTSPEEQWKLCVAAKDKEEILEKMHDDPTAGHLGVAKTLVRLAWIYYWPGILREATQYVRNCNSCPKHESEQQQPAGKMHALNTEQP